MQQAVNVLAGEDPFAMVQFGDHRPFEALIPIQRPVVIRAMVGEDCERQLRRPAATIAPIKSRWTVVPQIETGVEPAPVHHDDDGIALAPPGIILHRAPSMSCCTSSAVRCSGSMSG